MDGSHELDENAPQDVQVRHAITFLRAHFGLSTEELAGLDAEILIAMAKQARRRTESE
ncbi:MAG TPA: hypothetical protein VMU49_02145 [Candidatus Acidoferrales bacterium]|nr:hypothetical protein [Candidatus Acidoferrales bacterium]